MPGIRPALLYMATIRDSVAKGDLDEMRGLAMALNAVLRDSDAESDEVRELKVGQQELLAAIAERSSVTLEKNDVIAVREGIVVIDNVELGRALRILLQTDAEPRITVTISW